METNDYLLKIKKKYNEIMMGTNSIAKLMTEKVEDMRIIKELPMNIDINGFTLYIGNFNLENERKFFRNWAAIVGTMCARITNMEVTTERKKDLIEKADFHTLANKEWMHEFLLMDKFLEKQICKLLRNTLIKQQQFIAPNRDKSDKKKLITWRNANYKWWKKNIDSETLIQICALTYLYNFDAVKKNLQILAGRINIKQQMETYMYFWLQNWDGLTGKFLEAQAPSIDYAFRDKPRDNTDPQKNQKDSKVKLNG